MTAPLPKPSRSDPGADSVASAGMAHIDAGPLGGAAMHRRKPSRSEPEDELEAVEYQDDHDQEQQRLQTLNRGEEEIPSKATIPEDFYHKKWYNSNDVYKQLDAARAEVATDEDFVPGQGPALMKYLGVESSRPTLGSKPDRSELKDPNDAVATYMREAETSHKPSRSEAE
ncbi:hypothetical protein KFL_007260070 [Klebsormidium nitens]|uniref:Uncharacterized protein n=1 Tax=Klebsormidium nitens TaxID=105231 RepID=A0A1Y1ILR8_KLENI|nr:hypothetical protein KFL_007260070 [Klebsormidium nitens]|eukprot:GAQ91092.1 hypothetical protein KFL_007260070 [Klebsormidium nitens]